MLHAILTKLGHNNNDHLPFMSPNFEGVKGHVGVKRSNLRFSGKTFQLNYVLRFFHEIWDGASSEHSLQKLSNEKKIKGH